MSLQEKMKLLGLVGNRILNYANNDPEVADFMLKNKIVIYMDEIYVSIMIML